MAHQSFTLMVAIVTLVATIFLYIVIPKGLLPQQDTGVIIGVTDAAENISFKAMMEHVHAISEIVRQDPDVASVSASVGAGTVNATVNTARLFIVLKPHDQRSASAEEIIDRLRERDARRRRHFALHAGGAGSADRHPRQPHAIPIHFAGCGRGGTGAVDAEAGAKTRPASAADRRRERSAGQWLAAQRRCRSRESLAPQCPHPGDRRHALRRLRPAAGLDHFHAVNQFRVILEVEPQFQTSPDVLDKIYVKSTTGQPVPLSAFATMTVGNTPLSIPHQGQFPAATISFNLRNGSSLEPRHSRDRKGGAGNRLAGHDRDYLHRRAAEFRSVLTSEPFLILAAVVVIYIVLGVLYESYIHPITILSTLPTAGVGALLACSFAGTDFSLVALIGIILLIGIVKKNAIMMIDFALEAERKEGMSPEESIYQACLLRFRPIMMTTAAALLGALPLALEHGTGSELRRPLGISIVGGLLLSQFLTLYTTPVIYLYLERAWDAGSEERRRRGRLRQAAIATPNGHRRTTNSEPEPAFARWHARIGSNNGDRRFAT